MQLKKATKVMKTQQSTSLCDIKYKIVFLGDMSVGKTSIIQRFVKDQFDSTNNPTVGIDFLSRNLTLKGRTYRLQLWDTAGQQKYKSLIPAYLRDAHCAVFVFDVNRNQSLQNLRGWVQLYREHQSQESFAIMVGNKIDVGEERAIGKSKSHIQQFQLAVAKLGKQQDMEYVETSAKTGKNVNQLFNLIVDRITTVKDNPSNSKSQQQTQADKILLTLTELNQRQTTINCCYI